MSHSSPSTSKIEFGPGDVVSIYAPSAGYPKYHLCVCALVEDGVAQFLYLNSRNNGRAYESDYTLAADQVPCLPISASGLTIVSCSGLPKYNAKQLDLYQAKRLGLFPVDLIPQLLDFVQNCDALTPAERRIVVAGLSSVLP